MHLAHDPTARRLAAVAAPILLVVAATGCELDGLAALRPDGPVSGVGITLGFAGYASHGFLTVGDRDTIRAQAYTGVWPSYTKYDSQTEPRQFVYRSSNHQVATVDADGIVTTVGTGITLLSATSEGVASPPLELTISPPASQLRATPASFHVAVGDTIVLTVMARGGPQRRDREALLDRLHRARSLLGGVDALQRFLAWKAPEER